MDRQISSDSFIELFIAVKQMKHYGKTSELYLPWTFNINTLQEFILHSKNDYRYSEFLSCFNFVFGNGVPFCLEFYLSINRAKSKFLISGVFDDEAHITKNYNNARVISESENLYDLMELFVTDFDTYVKDKSGYLRGNTIFGNNRTQEYANNARNIFELARRMTNKFEDKEEI